MCQTRQQHSIKIRFAITQLTQRIALETLRAVSALFLFFFPCLKGLFNRNRIIVLIDNSFMSGHGGKRVAA